MGTADLTVQRRPDGRTCDPCLLEFGIGNGHVDYMEVQPLVDDLSHIWNIEIIKFELLDEGHDRRGIPVGYGVEVPMPRACRALALTEAETQSTQAITKVDSRNLQRV